MSYGDIEATDPVNSNYPFITDDVARIVLNEIGPEKPDWSKFPFEIEVSPPPNYRRRK